MVACSSAMCLVSALKFDLTRLVAWLGPCPMRQPLDVFAAHDPCPASSGRRFSQPRCCLLWYLSPKASLRRKPTSCEL